MLPALPALIFSQRYCSSVKKSCVRWVSFASLIQQSSLQHAVMTTKLTIEYDGTDFSGWAFQPGVRTIQGELETAIATILRRPVALAVAGRTDAGVHAWGQVASHEGAAAPLGSLNAVLPPDVAVVRSDDVADGFDARRACTSRAYCYRVLARPGRSALERSQALHWTYARRLRTRCATARRCWPARTTSRPSLRPRPTTCVSTAMSTPHTGACASTTCSSSGSRPTRSCAT